MGVSYVNVQHYTDIQRFMLHVNIELYLHAKSRMLQYNYYVCLHNQLTLWGQTYASILFLLKVTKCLLYVYAFILNNLDTKIIKETFNKIVKKC